MYRSVAIIVAVVLTFSLVSPIQTVFATDDADAVTIIAPIDSSEAEKTPEPSAVLQSENGSPSVPAEPQAISETTQVAPMSQSAVPMVVSNANVVATEPETTPGIIVTSLLVSSTVEYVELYNQEDKPYNIADIHLQLKRNSEVCTLSLQGSGWLLSKSFLAVSSPTSHSLLPMTFSSDCALSGDATSVEVFYKDARLQLIDGITVVPAKPWLRHKSTVTSSCADKAIPSSLKQSGSALNDFIACGVVPLLRTSNPYSPPAQTNLKIMEIMSDSRSCGPTELAEDCADFIKFKNTGSTPINLAELRLRMGASTATASASNTFHWGQATLNPLRDEYMLEPDMIFTLKFKDDTNPLSVTNGDGNVWIEDYYGTTVYQAVSYQDMDLAAASGKSWAYDTADGIWKYGVPSPERENDIFVPPTTETVSGDDSVATLKPCRDDQYRSEETNRCRSIAQASTLSPCKEGQYRNEETNRCRSIALAAASTLKPCADDQFRSPETNRCRKIASAEDAAAADCGEGRERNPLTNRCRNIVRSAPAPADFAVEPVKEPASVFIGWWLLGGVALLIVGYAGWEWREEIGQKIRKITQFVKAGR